MSAVVHGCVTETEKLLKLVKKNNMVELTAHRNSRTGMSMEADGQKWNRAENSIAGVRCRLPTPFDSRRDGNILEKQTQNPYLFHDPPSTQPPNSIIFPTGVDNATKSFIWHQLPVLDSI